MATDNLREAAESLLIDAEPVETAENDEAEEIEEIEAEVEDGDEQAEVEDAEADPEAEEDDDAETDDDDDAEDEAEDSPQFFKVKVDGEEIEVPVDELTRSYSGQKYIQKGMQEAAAKRQEAEAVYTALQQELTRISEFGQQIAQNGMAPPPQPPDAQLAQDDPIGYMQDRARYEAELANYQQQQSQFQQVSQQAQQAQERATQAHIAEQQQLLAREIPEYADPEKGKRLRAELREVAKAYGYDDNALSRIGDARDVKVLHDAMQWRKLQASKGEATKKGEKARPVVKPKAPKRVNAEDQRQKELRQRLKKTGDVRAAAELLLMPGKGT